MPSYIRAANNTSRRWWHYVPDGWSWSICGRRHMTLNRNKQRDDLEPTMRVCQFCQRILSEHSLPAAQT